MRKALESPSVETPRVLQCEKNAVNLVTVSLIAEDPVCSRGLNKGLSFDSSCYVMD